MKPQIYSIGHSNYSLERLLGLLAQHRIEALADIRRFAGSRKFPHLNQESLAAATADAGIEYHWLEALGGRRSTKKGGPASRNLGLRNESFRNYADYMHTDAFRRGVEKLLELAADKRTAIMCAEAVFWRCHRRLVSDFLLANGIAVRHIMPSGELHQHTLTSGAKAENGEV
ncbi:MAG TPA: DUF488 domain-containing protein, partial [Urbifossiella sp.]